MQSQIRIIIEQADKLKPLFENEVLTGYSGRKFIALLQHLSSCIDKENEVYLEIGVFQGLSLLSVAKSFSGECLGIDNFSQFDPNFKNKSIIESRINKLGINNIRLINEDFEIALSNLEQNLANKKIGLLFVDAAHDYRSQLMCLLFAKKHMSVNCIVVIDDSNYRHVRQANQDFLNIFPEFKLILEKYTCCHPQNMSEEEIKSAKNGWWDGVNVLVRDKEDNFRNKKITNEDIKQLFLNEQYIQTAKYADCAYEAIRVANALKPFNPLKLISRLINLKKFVNKSDKKFHGEFKYLNTFTRNKY